MDNGQQSVDGTFYRCHIIRFPDGGSPWKSAGSAEAEFGFTTSSPRY